MVLALWRSPIAHALQRNRSLVYARYLQLATVRSDGRPANRTVVFRGFRDDTDQLKFIADDRSEKVEQIDYSTWAEICWYFPNTREQFRLLGTLTLVKSDTPDADLQQARQAMWQDLSDSARVQFDWAHPGKPKTEALSASPPSPIAPLPHFCLLLLEPSQVDHLELRGEPQNRFLYCQADDRSWSKQEVNP